MPEHTDARSRDFGGIADIIYDDFDYGAHRVTGSASEALDWIGRSSLPEEDKAALRVFVARFPGIVFHRDEAALLDHLERRNAVVLPSWLREVRQVLSGPGPEVQVRLDFDRHNPPADHDGNDYDESDSDDLWYEDNFFGYRQDEERDLLKNGAECYPILSATTSVNYLLAADLGNPDNRHIVDVCDEDVMDDLHDGRPGTDSVSSAFVSYASMLTYVIECRTEDGTVVRALDLA
ncbi:hypothetical protein ACIRL2_38755 [Embleya sp. NPDC127516]|uniref:hypothetical protein n=1 Tax=Embleya sp. NPDC127516 TaxID=3363990 RepID=UPI0038119808